MRTKFTPIQIAIHWTVFLIVAATYATIELKGFVPKSLPLHQLLTLLHFSFGFCVLALMCLRIFVRLMYVTPGIVPKPPQWQQLLAQLTHLIIYMMFISIPILGILSLYFKGVEWTLFSLKMPITIAPDLAFSRQLKSIHEFIANAGYYLIGLHAAAALFHHYIAHDNTLLRMMPGRKSAKL